MKHKKKALFQSVMALLLCLSMLVGTTFAWFTDSVSSASNIIQSGRLDIELHYSEDLTQENGWKDASNGAIFNYQNWEPGYTDLKYLKIDNTGNLAFTYQLSFALPKQSSTAEDLTMDGGSQDDNSQSEENTDNVADGGELLAASEGGEENANPGNTAEGGSPEGSASKPAVSDPLKLAEAIDVYYANVTQKFVTREEAVKSLTYVGTLSDLLKGKLYVTEGILLPEESLFSKNAELPAGVAAEKGSTTAAILLKMREDAGNEYMNLSAGDGFCVQVLATQYAFEKDAFGNDFDTTAAEQVFPAFTGTDAEGGNLGGTGSVTTDESGKVTEDTVIGGATISQGTLVDNGTKELTVSITEKSSSDANLTLGDNEALRALDVHIEGVSPDNTVPIQVDLGQVLNIGLNQGNVTLYHVETSGTNPMNQVFTLEELDAHNEFYYDPATGHVMVSMATFSEVAVVSDTENAWEGEFDYTWYDASKTELTIANADQLAAFGAIVGGMNGQTQDSFAGKTVKLIADIDLGDEEENNVTNKIFYPIGYYNSTKSYEKTSGGSVTSSVSSFEGTFDGGGHTIANFYQNTWEMFGDYNDGYSGTPNYYKDAMGLFGYVLNGTVRNLTVDNFSSDGEFTPTGVIAAYADGDSTFENIAITKCNPRVYNTGNGGIIGIAGDTSAENDDHITLKNITVDNSNKISALWGSWDVACGGLVGMYRGNVDGSGNATGDTISFENCHVSAQIDVYNDVCANYQYYAYRYAGMIIGSVRHNTTNAEGKTIPNMTGISATGCTVNYGDWNDYYYCEFEKNTMASYSEDYQFSRVDKSEIIFDENGAITGCTHTHTDAEDKRAVYLPFHQLFTGYSWGVSSIGLQKYNGIVTDLGITEGDQENSVEKFETKFTGDFLYRVGNQNAVSVGSLFKAKDGMKIQQSGVVVTIDKVYDNSTVTIDFMGNATDWTKGTIKFNGTGVVKISIQDYNFCTPTVLYLEVVDAVNATEATSATSNNVVLLNDCGFGSLEVSGGYTLYGNGFTMTCGSDSAALDMGYSFVTLNNGTLDNVQIVTPNFDHAVLYKSNMTESGNRSETTDKTRYYNVKSGVMVSGDSQILNSRVSGARAAVNVTGGNCVIDNSRIELGAVASLLVGSANSLTLRDVTLVQKPTASTYNPNKKLMGFSVLFVCDADGNTAPVTLEGTLVQNAWVNENDKQYVPDAGQSIISTVLGKTEYLHDFDGDGKNESLNLGFAYMPESLTSKVNTTTITDNRTNKDAVPYDYAEVSILNGKTYVYSYKNTNGTADSFKTESEYKPNKQGDIITVTYSDTTDGLESGKSFGTDGWVYELNVDLDKASGYKLDFSKLSMTVNGTAVTDFKVNGSAKPTSPVAVTAGGVTYTLTATVDGKEYTATYKVTGTETSKESPSLVAANYEAGLCVASSYGGTWSGAAPALEGIQIKYWSVAEKQYKTINLSDYTPTTKGQQNGTNTTWTYSPENDDFTLTLTGGQVHSSNKVYAMPVVCNDKLYFVASKSTGLVNSGNSARSIPVSYSFKDNNNGDVLTFSHTWSVAENKDEQYKYSDFCSGTLTKLTSSSGGNNTTTCLAEGTMMTMADGSKRAIENLRKGDLVMSYDHLTGQITSNEVIIVVRTASDAYYKNTFVFDDGTQLVTINEHGIYDLNLNKYVNIDHENAGEYIGHDFVAVDAKGRIGTKKLVRVDSVVSSGYKYDIVTDKTLNYVAEDTLSVTHVLVDVINSFDFDSKMCYDQKKMQEDIAKYGLYTYDEWDEYCDISVFEQYNIPVMKVGISKGMYTKDYIIGLINTYVLDESVQIID